MAPFEHLPKAYRAITSNHSGDQHDATQNRRFRPTASELHPAITALLALLSTNASYRDQNRSIMLAIFALSIAAPVAKPVDFVWFGRTW